MNNSQMSPLTSSETVLLCGERFAPQGGMLDKFKLIHADCHVSKRKLAAQIYMAALVACRDTGCVRIEVREKKTMFGLRTKQSLYVEPGTSPVAWPPDTLEAGIADLAQQLRMNGRNEVRTIVYTLLGQDAVDPHTLAIDRVTSGLARRGFLQATSEKRLKIFTVQVYSPHSDTMARAAAAVDSVVRAMNSFHQASPELWQLLTAQIQAGMEERRERAVDNDD